MSGALIQNSLARGASSRHRGPANDQISKGRDTRPSTPATHTMTSPPAVSMESAKAKSVSAASAFETTLPAATTPSK